MGGYATEGERVVGRLVEARLRDTDRMWANQRVTDDRAAWSGTGSPIGP